MENKKEDLYDKIKRLANKTEDMIDEQVEKLKKSGTLEKISDYADKAEVYVEEKIEQFKNSDIPDKIDDFVDKTDVKVRETIKKAGEVGDKISEKIEDAFDNLKSRTKHKEDKPTDVDSNMPKPV